MTQDLAFLGVSAQGDGELAFNNTVCDGAYALAQKVLILLFLDLQSLYSLGYGTNLSRELAGSNNYDAGQLKGTFDIAIQRVTDIIQQNTPPDAPDESRLNRIECTVPEEARRGDTADIILTVFPLVGSAVTVRAPAPLNAD
jgi:hypothetical protein